MIAVEPFTVAALNRLDQAAFVAALDHVFELSPWVVRRAFARRPFESREALHDAMLDVLKAAPRDDLVALIRAHPDLAGKAAMDGALTAASANEQSGAGLDHLTAEEHAAFNRLNDAYRRRFGFPFVICARHNDKASILAAMDHRLGNTEAEEIDEAITQIGEIGRLRLFDAVPP